MADSQNVATLTPLGVVTFKTAFNRETRME